jgi:hypothetical protein
MNREILKGVFLVLCGLVANTALGDADTNGPIGINSTGLGLNGDGVSVGMVELFRPGVPGFDMPTNIHDSVTPTAVFRRDGNVAADMLIGTGHALRVAGTIISTHPTATGTAPNADLYASAYDPMGPTPDDFDAEAALAAQHIATRNGGDVRAINMSFGNPLAAGETTDGNSLLTLFVDWSSRVHDTLYVTAGLEMGPATPIPQDNFNGMTIAFSSIMDGVYRRVDAGNDFSQDVPGEFRTSIDLLAPGSNIELTNLGSTTTNMFTGTSYAAPHVVGTIALLQQFGDQRIAASAPRWDAEARRHEVMKAVLMNSADKIKDDGMTMVGGNAVPVGGFLGMERTVIQQDGMSSWLDSDAYAGFQPQLIPLDEELGAGHLNANRALQQFRNGEFDSDGADVPIIGWDFGHTAGEDDNNKYVFAQKLVGGSFISITLAWDRHVVFDNDVDMDGEFDIGDTFNESTANPPNDDQINDLDLYLLPKGAPDFFNPIASSESAEGTLEHIFFQIPTTGEYEFWVNQFDGDIPGGQDYAVAWWAVTFPGDYDGNGTVEINDYHQWKMDYGSSNLASDGSGDGMVNAADYPVWRNNLGATLGGGAIVSTSVPEPASAMLLSFGLAIVLHRGNRRRVSVA